MSQSQHAELVTGKVSTDKQNLAKMYENELILFLS